MQSASARASSGLQLAASYLRFTAAEKRNLLFPSRWFISQRWTFVDVGGLDALSSDSEIREYLTRKGTSYGTAISAVL